MAATTFAALKAAGFRGAAVRQTEADLEAVGTLVGVHARELHAIIDVESSGSGFYTDGRPKMLFEPHVFYRHIAGAKRDLAVKAGLAYPKWGTKPYPKDSYPRLIQAMAIDETAALLSCSWGLTQIMGENHVACGFMAPQDMVAAFADREAAQMSATVALIRSKGLANALKAHDWAAIAKGWNGAAYKANAYDTKLAAAYAKWGKPQTPKAAAKPLPSIAPLSFADRVGALFATLTGRAPAAA